MSRLAFPAQFLLFGASDAFILIAWFLWVSSHTSAPVKQSARLLAAGTLFWTQLALAGLLLGLTGRFTRSAELALNLGIPALLYYLNRRRIVDVLRDSVKQLRAVLRRPRGLGEWLMCSTIALAGLLAAWFVILNVYLPEGGYDDFVYHLPVVGFIVQNKGLGIVPVPLHFGNVNYFSQLGELFSLWNYSVLGSDALISTWQDGALAQLVLAAYVLCRGLGCRRLISAFAAALICFTPTLLLQTLTGYNDILIVTFFATGLALSMRPLPTSGWVPPLAVGLSCGLMLAAKMTAPVLIAAIAANVVFNSWERGNWHRMACGIRRGLAMIALGIVLVGSYWYVRNTIVFHNPMYPFEVQFMGRSLPGILTVQQMVVNFQNMELAKKPALERVFTPWLETRRYLGDRFYNYDSTWAGFGPIWFLLGAPSIVTALIAGLALRRWNIAALLLVIAAAFVVFPGNFVIRFSFFVLPAMAAAVAWTLQELAADRPLIPASIRGFLYRLPTAVIHGAGGLLGALTAALIIPATLFPVPTIKQIVSPVSKSGVPYTFMYNFQTVRHTIPRSAVVAFDETLEYLAPLWREDFANQVRYIPTTGTWEEWCSRARSEHVTHVFVKMTAGMFPSGLPQWIAAHPGKFQLLVHTGMGDLYKVSKT